MSTARKLLLTMLILGVFGGAAGFGAYAAFSATTANPGDSFQAGTVTIGDNDAGAALYNVANKAPGEYAESCIKITYTGSLPSTVRLYRSGFTGGTGLDAYIDLSITRGTGSQFNCSDFSGSTSVYAGTLSAVGTSFGSGVALTNGAGNASWGQNDAVTYRVRATLQNNNAAQGLITGTHSFTWEAQNT